MPIFWSPAELQRFRGTGLEGRPQADLPLLEDDFQSLLVRLSEKISPHSCEALSMQARILEPLFPFVLVS